MVHSRPEIYAEMVSIYLFSFCFLANYLQFFALSLHIIKQGIKIFHSFVLIQHLDTLDQLLFVNYIFHTNNY